MEEPSDHSRCGFRYVASEFVRHHHSRATCPSISPWAHTPQAKDGLLEQHFTHLHHEHRLNSARVSIQRCFHVIKLKPSSHCVSRPVCIRQSQISALAQSAVPKEKDPHVERPDGVLREGYRARSHWHEALPREEKRILPQTHERSA